MTTDKPIFEVIEPGGHAYRIWPDGRTEGFGDSIVINRIPMITNARITEAFRVLGDPFKVVTGSAQAMQPS